MRRKRRPFDIFGIDEIFERILEEMEDMMPIDERELSIYRFPMTRRPGEELEIRELGNIRPHGGNLEIGERKPIIDVFESKDEVQVVAEMPGVEREDIKLDISENSLDINAKTAEREYSEHVDLPAKVDPNSAKATYKNGVLEVIFKRVEHGEKRESIRVE